MKDLIEKLKAIKINFKLIGIIVGAAAVLVLIFLLVYNVLLPKISYRQFVFALTGESEHIRAVAVRGGETMELTDSQTLAVISWLAEYRSENEGVDHASEHEGFELCFDYHDPDGRAIVIYVEPRAVVFPGIMGSYRITVENNDIYSLIAGLERD